MKYHAFNKQSQEQGEILWAPCSISFPSCVHTQIAQHAGLFSIPTDVDALSGRMASLSLNISLKG